MHHRFLAMWLVLALFGCTQAAPTPSEAPQDTGSSPTQPADASLPPGLAIDPATFPYELPTADPAADPFAEPVDPTSHALIQAALDADELSQEEALLLEVYAVYGDRRLPERFAGAVDHLEGHHVMRRVSARWADFSPEQRSELEPFYRPPLYINSWAGGQQARAARPQAAMGGMLAQTEEDPCKDLGGQIDMNYFIDPFWESIPAAGGKALVWWRRLNNPDLPDVHEARDYVDSIMEQAAREYAEVVDEVWPAYADLMGRTPLPDGDVLCYNGGSDAFDIYLYDRPIPGYAAVVVAYPPECTGSPAFALLPTYWYRNYDGEVPFKLSTLSRWTIAHELFHAFQFAFPFGGECETFVPLDEATATWAADLVFPLDQNEHRFDSSILFASPLFDDLFRDSGYQDWVFFMSLVQQEGLGVIQAIYEKAASSAHPLEAIDDAVSGGFEQVLPEFAVHAWNQDPIDSYRNWDSFNDHPSEFATKEQAFALDGKRRVSADVEVGLKGMGRAYEDWKFADDVRHIRVENPSLGSDLVHVNALLHRVDDRWKETSWTGHDSIEYCRDEEDEDIDRIVVVWAYVGYPLENEIVHTGKTKVTVSDTCPVAYDIFYEYKASDGVGYRAEGFLELNEEGELVGEATVQGTYWVATRITGDVVENCVHEPFSQKVQLHGNVVGDGRELFVWSDPEPPPGSVWLFTVSVGGTVPIDGGEVTYENPSAEEGGSGFGCSAFFHRTETLRVTPRD